MARARWGHLELRTSFVASAFSPIEGREPAFEAGDAGSIPARGTDCGGRGVLECTPRCERGGAGSIPAGHPARSNWVWVNGWPPGPEPGPRRFDSCRPDGSRTRARPRRWPRDGPAPGPVDYTEMSAPSQGAGPGSTPGRVTTSHWSTRRMTPGFHSGERGSTPRWDTNRSIRECCRMVGNRSRKPGWW